MFRAVVLVVLHLLAFIGTLRATESERNGLRLTHFVADISPPLQRRVCVGFISEFTEIEHPLLAKGIILEDAGGVYVLCALDYCGLCNDSYDEFRRRIAEAAKTTPDRVAVQSLHQHTAPVFDANADRLLYDEDSEAFQQGRDAERQAIDAIVTAIEDCQSSWNDVTHFSKATAQVERVASNRRVEQPDGSIVVRYSAAGTDPAMRAAAEGLIDPLLRTITFYNGENPLVRLHYYATHPQSRSGGVVTYDTVGMARERVEQMTGVPQIYFTGCGGNVTLGKYNSGADVERAEIADRMYQAMTKAIDAADKAEHQPVTPIRWSKEDVRFPVRDDAAFVLDEHRRTYEDESLAFSTRLRSAMYVAWIDRLKSKPTVEFNSLAIGNVRIVHLPGEPFVQFQLHAQEAAGDEAFVAVAGYGQCAPWYIGEDRIYTDRGGYEQTWSFVGPSEELMHATIETLLSLDR